MKIKEIIAEEAAGAGYIPKNKREANDPRYAMAVTKDVKPGEDTRQAAKWGFKVGAGGKVPKLRADGKISENKLTELEPYKQNLAYQKATKIFSKKNLADRDIRDTAMTSFSKFLKTYGFKKLGTGSFAVTYEKPGYPWIFKVFTYDTPYKIFLDYVFKNQNNPNLPKLKGYYIKINDNTYVVRMEKLRPMKDNDNELIDFFDNYIGRNPGLKMPKQAREWLTKKYPGVLQVLDDLQPLVKGKGYILDLHDQNIMLRGNVPVITDPFANMNYVW